VESEQLRNLRAAFDAWNRGDFDGVLELQRDDVVWRLAGALPDLDPAYEGKEGVRRFWRDFSEPWEEISISLEEIIDERDAQLLVVVRFVARGREGIEVDMPFFQIYRFDDRAMLEEFESYAERDEAERAAGLSD
jgi:ketosteroid isomerase-like protein